MKKALQSNRRTPPAGFEERSDMQILHLTAETKPGRRMPRAAVIRQGSCGTSGWIQRMDTTALGLASQAMGAGRKTKEDVLDYSVGYILQVRIGDRVEADSPLCELHARNEAEAEAAERAVRQAVQIGPEPCGRAKLFHAEVTASGVRRL